MVANQISKGLQTLIFLMTIISAGTPMSRAQVTHIDAKTSHSGTQQGQTLRPFTVADSIESTHFVVPEEHTSEHPPSSPDGKRFFVVTERGLLESNLREYVLMVFEFARPNKSSQVAVFRTSSNRPGILNPKWISNGSISLIGENPHELPQVYVVNCKTENFENSQQHRKVLLPTTSPRI